MSFGDLSVPFSLRVETWRVLRGYRERASSSSSAPGMRQSDGGHGQEQLLFGPKDDVRGVVWNGFSRALGQEKTAE